MCDKINTHLPDSIALPVVTLWSSRDVQIQTTFKTDVKSLIRLNSQIKELWSGIPHVSYSVL